MSNDEIEEAMKGLKLREDGLLIDEKTGEVINEYGATRFDVATRALRGEFDPPPGTENHERAPGVLMDSLVKWPAVYDFQFVMKSQGEDTAAMVDSVRQRVVKICEAPVEESMCSVRERMGGKYVSMTIPALVRAPQIIQKVFAVFEGDDRIVMKF